ncbi:MAG: hypothetical protein J5I90_08165 [Caldilineales bacterium]|nr:hypothetical protein [Caldilineales bacterium]
MRSVCNIVRAEKNVGQNRRAVRVLVNVCLFVRLVLCEKLAKHYDLDAVTVEEAIPT